LCTIFCSKSSDCPPPAVKCNSQGVCEPQL
jgi:hypothetical protein